MMPSNFSLIENYTTTKILHSYVHAHLNFVGED